MKCVAVIPFSLSFSPPFSISNKNHRFWWGIHRKLKVLFFFSLYFGCVRQVLGISAFGIAWMSWCMSFARGGRRFLWWKLFELFHNSIYEIHIYFGGFFFFHNRQRISQIGDACQRELVPYLFNWMEYDKKKLYYKWYMRLTFDSRVQRIQNILAWYDGLIKQMHK